MEKILTLHPTGKSGKNISKEKYDVVREAIVGSLPEPIRFDQFFELVKPKLTGFEGSITWYVETVKLDLEARGIVEHNRSTRMIRKI